MIKRNQLIFDKTPITELPTEIYSNKNIEEQPIFI